MLTGGNTFGNGMVLNTSLVFADCVLVSTAGSTSIFTAACTSIVIAACASCLSADYTFDFVFICFFAIDWSSIDIAFDTAASASRGTELSVSPC